MDLWYSPEFKKEYGIGAYGCDRLAKDLPAIGAPREHYDDSDKSGPQELYISNIDTDGGCSEGQILPLMKKIHRSYAYGTDSIMDGELTFQSLKRIKPSGLYSGEIQFALFRGEDTPPEGTVVLSFHAEGETYSIVTP